MRHSPAWHINLLTEPTSDNKRQAHDHGEREKKKEGRELRKGARGEDGEEKRRGEKIDGDAGETRGETTMMMIEGGRRRRKTWKKCFIVIKNAANMFIGCSK